MKRADIRSVLVLGSGPIVIGQACEFDYSGTQALKALREEGFRTILVNSNPATIMTDPEMADRTYIEPITADAVERVIARERPDALLPTIGGQTALNCAVELDRRGVLERHGVRMIGATTAAIRRAEERELFKRTVQETGLDLPRSGTARTLPEARALLAHVGLPCVLRPSFTLGGTGGGIAYNREEFDEIAAAGLAASPVREILVEEFLGGWKEFELEVMRDYKDNVVVICSIENIDPMGVHTGDSITVAPALTLTDKEYQRMRKAAQAVIRAVGVETGGSNIQFAVDPRTGRLCVIEMNPRVSRSSALASKATGYPIARIATKLAIGYSLDELPNDITGSTPASFEPAIDYCVVKIPRFAFEKFPGADPTLTTSMKSVGEVMAIGRTFKEALQKGYRSLESGRAALPWDRYDPASAGTSPDAETIRARLARPNAERLLWARPALRTGISAEEIASLTGIDPWFIRQVEEIVDEEEALARVEGGFPTDLLRRAKRMGFSDARLAVLERTGEAALRARREALGIRVTFKEVDTCAAEFPARTPYYYSTYEEEDDLRLPPGKRVVILGSGPNRIGQGIEFDYSCVHAAQALREEGYVAVMVNSNPETVSTDYDTSDLLFFEPLTLEDVLAVCDRVDPVGVVLQFGGQTPLLLSRALTAAGVRVLGTSADAIDLAEDRDRFRRLIEELGLRQPESGIARDAAEARRVATALGFPVLLRPSYVLGGRAMEIVYDAGELDATMARVAAAALQGPVLVDKFLDDAIEVDVDAVADGEDVFIGGILEHVEEAGVHSGDASMALPPYTLAEETLDAIRDATRRLARALDVRGLMNCQFAVKDGVVHVLEVNPRASRTVPFVSKATGVPLARVAMRVMLGRRLREMGLPEDAAASYVAVKASVFPFNRFPGVDIVLGPEMRSTGEVMGIDWDFGAAFAKACEGAGFPLPTAGTVLVSVKEDDKQAAVYLAKRLADLGFKIVATGGTHRTLARNGVEKVRRVRKIGEGRPDVLDVIKNREVDLVVNTPSGKTPHSDGARIRALTVSLRVPCITTIAAAQAAVSGIEALRDGRLGTSSIQEYIGSRTGGSNSFARPHCGRNGSDGA